MLLSGFGTFTQILITCLILLILYLIRIHLKIQAIKKSLSDWIVHPGQLPFIGHAKEIMSNLEGNDIGFHYLARLCWEKYDHQPFVFFPLGSDHMVVLSDPENCLYIDKNPGKYPRGWGYKHDSPLLGVKGEVIFANHGQSWDDQRKRLHPHFRAPTLRAQYPNIVSCCQEAEKILSKGGDFQMKPIFIRITLDVIFKHIFGYKLPPEGEFLVDFFTKLLGPELQIRVSGLFYLPLPSRLKFFSERKKVLDFLKAETRKAEGFLTEIGGTIDEKMNDIMGLIFAGFETTGNTVCWILYHLYQEEGQKTLHLIHEELAGMPTKDIDEWEVNDLREHSKYLFACLNETLRLHSPTTGHVGDAAEDHVLNGKRVPKGTPFFTFQFAYYLSPKYFKDPQHWNPDRWLNGEVEEAAKKANMTVSEFFHPFMIGAHTCIGKVLAEVESLTLVARLTSKFNFEYIGAKPPQHNFCFVLGIDHLPMRVTLKSK